MATLNLVTGGAGFIGRHLVQLLIEQGETVRVLDVAISPELPPRVERIQGSITDPEAVRAALVGVDRVFHLAAITDLWVKPKRRFGEVNLDGTKTVLEAARAARVGCFVHTSSETVFFGRSRPPAEIDECVEVAPDQTLGPYCRSKREAELQVLAAAAEGFPAVVVAPTMPVGPGDHHRTPPTRLLVDLLNQNLPAYLDWIMNLVDVRDAARGHLLAAARGQIGTRYLLSGSNLRMRELLHELERMTGVRMPRRRVPYPLAWLAGAIDELLADRFTGRPPQAPLTGVRLAGCARPFSSARAATELGYVPRPRAETLADAIAWLRAQGLLHDLRQKRIASVTSRSAKHP